VRAAVVSRHGLPDVIELREDWPEPDAPGPGEVLIAVEASGLNPSDTKIRSGGGASGQISLPYVPGREAAGRVLQAGEGASRFQPGEEVFAFFGWHARPGGHAQRLVVAAEALARRPPGIALHEAAGLPLAGLTAQQGLEALAPPAGARVLVTSGSGGVGHLAVQLAVAAGYEVVATTGPDNLEFVRGLGASVVLDYRDPGAPGPIQGIGYVLDSVGPANIAQWQAHLGPGARLAAVAGVPAQCRQDIHVSRIRCQADGERLAHLAGLMAEGRLAVTVQEVFPLSRLAQAHRLLEGGHVRGKLVIDVTA
jgi:2-desacetyl-2-hydroxyethyl bacteriochlorophyllide A dehydrogenase